MHILYITHAKVAFANFTMKRYNEYGDGAGNHWFSNIYK